MSNQYDPNNFYSQNNVNQFNTYYQPGQMDFPVMPPMPPIPPLPKRPYSHGVLSILFLSSIVAIVFAFIPGALHNIGVSLILGILVSVAILDWKGFTSLNGRIKWRQMSTAKCWLLAFAFFAFSPFLLVFYLASNALKSNDAIKQHQPQLPAPKGRPALGCATGLMVMLFSLPFAFAATTTNAPTSQQANIRTQVQSTPAQKPTIVPTPTPTLQPTPTPRPTPTPQPKPTPTSLPVQQPAKAPAQQPTPPPVQQSNPQPQPTPPPQQPVGVNGNPWGYNFDSGNLIYSPPSDFCAYFNCIASFWKSTNGYVDECYDATYSHSGGVSGACSKHGGEMRPLYSH